jgi:RNA polymerase sigma factor (sigma-70 family)
MSALLGAGARAANEPAERTRELYERYGQRVFTFCYTRLRNREEAQDAAQTTFIYAMRALARGVEPEFELAWLLKIAFNVCRATRRSARWRTSLTSEGAEAVDELPDVSAADDVERSASLEGLRAALRSLPESQQRAILLREWQGLSYAEIADDLDMSVGAVETLLFRARRNLAGRLQHVRGGVQAIDVASLAPLLRSLARGAGAKLTVCAAAASVALLPVAAVHVLQVRADHQRAARAALPVDPVLRSATADTAGQRRSAATSRPKRNVHPLIEPRSHRDPTRATRRKTTAAAPPASPPPAPAPGPGADSAAQPPASAATTPSPAIIPPPPLPGIGLPEVVTGVTSALPPVQSPLPAVPLPPVPSPTVTIGLP